MILNKKSNDSKTIEILKKLASQTRLTLAQVWDSLAVEILIVPKEVQKFRNLKICVESQTGLNIAQV